MTCPQCGTAIERKPMGRPPIYCSSRCRLRAFKDREAEAYLATQPQWVRALPTRDDVLALAQLLDQEAVAE